MNSSISLQSHISSNEGSAFDVYEIQYDVQLAANIIDTRMKRGMTQEELAKKMKTVQPVIARAENGNLPPSHKLLKKIARALEARLIPASFALEESSQTLQSFSISKYSTRSNNELRSISSMQLLERIPFYVEQLSSVN